MSISDVVFGFNVFVLAYFIVLNSSYLVLLYSAGRELFGFMHRARIETPDELMRSPLTPSVGVIAPAWNEEAGVVDSVRSLLALEYPDARIIVVNDGSSDDTLARLVEAFDLERVEYAYAEEIPTQPLLDLYRSRTESRVVVADKQNGGKADAINCGINIAETDLVCVIDADSVLDASALATSARPFVDDPDRVVAVGGIVRIINDCVVERGFVQEVRLPRAHLARIQVMEYLRRLPRRTQRLEPDQRAAHHQRRLRRVPARRRGGGRWLRPTHARRGHGADRPHAPPPAARAA
ncbi:MAG: glycosyltransferase family 2 protein [Thermoleophilia bacterium]|nr:glycosyltransferase family 2 protein [Thermoleophilia bacterium]